jgi:heparosan-N-sulfate-glucuronate 5-epimerase
VGYESTPRGRRISSGGYYIDFTEKTTAESALRPETLLPAALAQLALGWWERLIAGDTAAEREFFVITDLLERRSRLDGGSRIWEYNVPDRKYGMQAPTISALAQAQAASVFVRKYARDRDDRSAILAHQAIQPLLAPERPTTMVMLRSGLAMEEAPSNPPSLILNGWIYSLWGLRDVAIGLDDEVCHRVLRESTNCLASLLPSYDVGWWSRYSLYPHRIPDLAKPFYHRLHVEQLDVLAELTGDQVFATYAARWRGYDTFPRQVRAILQKAVFVLSGYR